MNSHKNKAANENNVEKISNSKSMESIPKREKNCSSSLDDKPITMEPTLGEKLVKKRAVSAELEEKLQRLRKTYDINLKSVELMKEDLRSREIKLLHSLKQIRCFIRDMHALKLEAEKMSEEIDIGQKYVEYELDMVHSDYFRGSEKKNVINRFRELFVSTTSYMNDVIKELPIFTSAKKLVEYCEVLKTLSEDLSLKQRERDENEEELREEGLRLTEEHANHPFQLMKKENAYHFCVSQKDSLVIKSMCLDQQIESISSEKLNRDVEWNEAEKWIEKIYITTRGALPQKHATTPTSNVREQLDEVKRILKTAQEIVQRLRE